MNFSGGDDAFEKSSGNEGMHGICKRSIRTKSSAFLPEPAKFQCSFSFLKEKEFLATAEFVAQKWSGCKYGKEKGKCCCSKRQACILPVWEEGLIVIIFIHH